MKKNTLIALLIASSLTLAGCASTTGETPNGAIDTTSPTATAEPTLSRADELFKLTQEGFLALTPTESSDQAQSELRALVLDSLEAGSSAMYEELSFDGDNIVTVLYRNEEKSPKLLSFILDDKGVLIEGTASIQDSMSLNLQDLSVGFTDGAVKAVSKDEDGGYLVSIKYPQENGTDISLIYYVVVKDGLVATMVTTADYSPDMTVAMLKVSYGVNAEYEKLYDVAVEPQPGS